MDDIQRILELAPARLESCESREQLELVAADLIGKRSHLAEAMRTIGSAPPDERPKLGALLKEARERLSGLIEKRRAALELVEEGGLLEDERVDVTLPELRIPRGRLHLLIETMNEVVDIFVALGYQVEGGPEVELAYYNFDALNTPPGHPARAESDTIYVDYGDPADELLMRAHTSPVQARYMEKHDPPVFIVVPGRVFRHDSGPTNSPVFHQVEGLAVGDDITFADLRGTLAHFTREFFGQDKQVRFRPGFFPFTEPSAEMDVSWGDGWLELLGCGVVDPNVLEAVGYDSSVYSGFAFGMGVERLAMERHGIRDIRHFYSNDLRILEQFA